MPSGQTDAIAKRSEGHGLSRPAGMQGGVLAGALAALAVLATVAFEAWGGLGGDGARGLAGVLIGAFAGIALYHARFGFAGGWRRLIRERRGRGARAQLVLLGAAILVTYPLIGWEGATGLDVHPVILPMTLASTLGAFAFGVGMQLGGSCASGTLFTVGGGSTRMVVTLAAFVAGSVIATAHWSFWIDLSRAVPRLPAWSAVSAFGPIGGLALALGLLGALWLGLAAVERRAHGALEGPAAGVDLLRGPWPALLGAGALALVVAGHFLVYGRPWGVTAGFALWGAKIAQGLGVDVASWPYWSGWRAEPLAASVFADRVSLTNMALVLGALAAAALAGRFAPALRVSRLDAVTAVIGGLMMGYGARLAFGCNIGAFLGGVASGSAHGLWWLLWGFLGTLAGVALRARLGMDPPAR